MMCIGFTIIQICFSFVWVDCIVYWGLTVFVCIALGGSFLLFYWWGCFFLLLIIDGAFGLLGGVNITIQSYDLMSFICLKISSSTCI